MTRDDILKLVDGFEEEVVSIDPLRVRVTVPCRGDGLRLRTDESTDVLEVEERIREPGTHTL